MAVRRCRPRTKSEQGDWKAYVLRRPSRRRAIEMRPVVAQLAAGIPELALRAEELLRREAGDAGYAQLVLAADGLTPVAADAELALAKEAAA